MIKLLVVLTGAVALAGCSSLTGGATYTYSRTSAEQCTLVVDSARVVEGGIAVSLDECDVTVEAGKVTSGSNSISDEVAPSDPEVDLEIAYRRVTCLRCASALKVLGLR